MPDLYVEDRGQGIPVLFVHGFPLDCTMWQGQIDGLADVCRVIAPDLRGFGRNQPAETDIVTMEQFADDLNGLLDELQVRDPIVFCGLSMGGYVGFRFLEKYGDRLRGLILCDTRPQADTDEAAKNRRTLAERVLRLGPQPALDAMLPKLVSERSRDERPEVVERLREIITATDRRSIAAALLGMAQRPDSTPLLPAISVPTLAICGTEDILTPPDVMRPMSEQMTRSRYLEIPDAGHMAPLEDPTAVNAAIREFLQSL